jgi:hypothetical protein
MMNLTNEQRTALTEIHEGATDLWLTMSYHGHDPERPSAEEAVATLAKKLADLTEILLEADKTPATSGDMATEDYEDYYGWGCQDI